MDRRCGGGGRRRLVLSAGMKTARFFEGEDAGGGCGRGAWRESAEVVWDIAFLLRRAAGGEAKRRCVTGSAATVMRGRSWSGSVMASARGARIRKFRR